MPDIFLKSQALDLAFHPREDVLFAALLDGQIRCYSYGLDGTATLRWKMRPSKKSCRALDVRPDGLHLWVGTKSGSIQYVFLTV
jgi:WD repeat-containing protein 55